MKRSEFITMVGAAAAAALSPLGLQRSNGRTISSASAFSELDRLPPPWIDGLRKGLREHGLIEGRNIAIEFGLAQSTAEVPGVAAQLIRRKVDVLFASGTPSLVPARDAAGPVPIVFVAAVDFAEPGGLVSSVAHPGGNMTGISAMLADTFGKRLELLKELLPELTSIAILVRSGSPARHTFVRQAEEATRILGFKLRILDMRKADELDALFDRARGAGALLLADDAAFTARRRRIAELALKHRLPTMFGFSDMPKAGGLMSYGPDYAHLYWRAADYIYKVLNGAKPANLPIERPTKFEFVINLKTAKALGLDVPQTLLVRATAVVEE